MVRVISLSILQRRREAANTERPTPPLQGIHAWSGRVGSGRVGGEWMEGWVRTEDSSYITLT